MKIEELLENKIIAIIRGVSSENIINTVKALSDGGIRAVEITFNQKEHLKYLDTLKSIALIKEHFGNEIFLGAGTVLTEECVEEAIKSGAEYIISPNVCEGVIKKTKELGAISIPGAFTPTEIVNAYDWGCDVVKLFPAGLFGTDYIKAVISPLNHIPVMAVGGITVENIQDFMKAGVVGVGIGGSLVDIKAVENGEFYKITEIAKKYCMKVY